MFVPSQWEMALHCNDIYHWLCASLELALCSEYALKELNGWLFWYPLQKCILKRSQSAFWIQIHPVILSIIIPVAMLQSIILNIHTLKFNQSVHNFTDIFFQIQFLPWNYHIYFGVSMKFFLKGLINNKPSLAKIMAWCQTGMKTLLETIKAQFTDEYTSLGLNGDGDISYPDSKVHEANMGPTWVLSAPGEPHVGPMNFAIRMAITATQGLQIWKKKNTLRMQFFMLNSSWSTNAIRHYRSLIYD